MNDLVLFSAVLRPHRSADRRGINIVVGCVAVMWLAVGLFFLNLGAWPIFPFLGVEVALLYVALRLNLRAGRAVETIDLTRDALTVRRVNPWGRQKSWSFQPHWLQVITVDGEDGKRGVRLRSHGRSLVIGAYLAPEERLEVSQSLRRALALLSRPCGPGPMPAT